MLLTTIFLLLQVSSSTADSVQSALLRAEDGRAATAAELKLLTDYAESDDTTLRRIAIRALGRLERPDLVPQIASSLTATQPSIRIAAVDAIAQSVWRTPNPEAFRSLSDRLTHETNAEVRRAILAAIGRIRSSPDKIRSRENTLASWLDSTGIPREGALRGLSDLYRRSEGSTAAGYVVEQLKATLATSPHPRERQYATTALATTNQLDETTLRRALSDQSIEVRRLAARTLRRGQPLRSPDAGIELATHDASFQVRLEGLAAYGQRLQRPGDCQPFLRALSDLSVHVQLIAIDQLDDRCTTKSAVTTRVRVILAEKITNTSWHRPAHALLALARLDPTSAGLLLNSFATNATPWVRLAAAGAASLLKNEAMLHRLINDVDANVAEAALRGLAELTGHKADTVALRAMASDDYQLVHTAAGLLEHSPLASAVAHAALQSFRRISDEGKLTSRDPRLVLLDRIAEFGTTELASALTPSLQDFDPRIAERVQELLNRWEQWPATTTGPTREQSSLPLLLPLPLPEALRSIRGATIIMRGGGRITIELFPGEAPTNVARFVDMARAHWFDGLTWHRVVPNFVLQGGSPHANEYAGGAGFTRDEVGGNHWRGTIGISTRGRDTGDGQLFINLVDNLRLDYDYTVIGQVTSGWEVVDTILLGAVIESIAIMP